MGREHVVRKTPGNSTDGGSPKSTKAKNATSDTVLRAELRMYPRKANGDV